MDKPIQAMVRAAIAAVGSDDAVADRHLAFATLLHVAGRTATDVAAVFGKGRRTGSAWTTGSTPTPAEVREYVVGLATAALAAQSGTTSPTGTSAAYALDHLTITADTGVDPLDVCRAHGVCVRRGGVRSGGVELYRLVARFADGIRLDFRPNPLGGARRHARLDCRPARLSHGGWCELARLIHDLGIGPDATITRVDFAVDYEWTQVDDVWLRVSGRRHDTLGNGQRIGSSAALLRSYCRMREGSTTFPVLRIEAQQRDLQCELRAVPSLPYPFRVRMASSAAAPLVRGAPAEVEGLLLPLLDGVSLARVMRRTRRHTVRQDLMLALSEQTGAVMQHPADVHGAAIGVVGRDVLAGLFDGVVPEWAHGVEPQ